jgi:hypothetical protein
VPQPAIQMRGAFGAGPLPQQVAGGQRARHQPTFARPFDRRGQRVGEVLVQLDGRHRRRPQLDGDRQLDAAAAEPLLQQRTDARLEVGQRRRNAQLDVEEPVIHGSHGDANHRAGVLVRERREPGHGLDHAV